MSAACICAKRACPVDGVVVSIAACGTDAAMLQHRLANPRDAGRASGAGGGDLPVDGEGPPNVGVAWKISPAGIKSDLVQEHHRLAWAGTEPLTMLRHRTTWEKRTNCSGRRPADL